MTASGVGGALCCLDREAWPPLGRPQAAWCPQVPSYPPLRRLNIVPLLGTLVPWRQQAPVCHLQAP